MPAAAAAGIDSLLRRPQRPTATRKSRGHARFARFRPGRPSPSRRAAPGVAQVLAGGHYQASCPDGPTERFLSAEWGHPFRSVWTGLTAASTSGPGHSWGRETPPGACATLPIGIRLTHDLEPGSRSQPDPNEICHSPKPALCLGLTRPLLRAECALSTVSADRRCRFRTDAAVVSVWQSHARFRSRGSGRRSGPRAYAFADRLTANRTNALRDATRTARADAFRSLTCLC